MIDTDTVARGPSVIPPGEHSRRMLTNTNFGISKCKLTDLLLTGNELLEMVCEYEQCPISVVRTTDFNVREIFQIIRGKERWYRPPTEIG